MATPTAPYGYVISRSTKEDAYGLWRFDPGSRNLLTKVRLKASASYPRGNSLVWIGGYLLGWSAPQPAMDGGHFYEYRLFPFDSQSTDPLSTPPLQLGVWSQSKFWGRGADFGNPEGGHKEYDKADTLTLIPFGSYLLNFIPTAGRGTYGLWNFDPCPTAPGSADPVPGDYSYTPQGSFRDIQLGHELIPLNGYVLDRERATGGYRLWSFDPQATNPITRPTIQEGTWTDIDKRHELVPVGSAVPLRTGIP